MKDVLLRRRFNYLDACVYLGVGAVVANGYFLIGILALLVGHIVVSAVEALYG